MPVGRSAEGGLPKPQKTLGELLTDPHFIFTIISLVISVSVFFYYLYQLLFHADDDEENKKPAAERKRFRWTAPPERTQKTKSEETATAKRPQLARQEPGADKKTDEVPGKPAASADVKTEIVDSKAAKESTLTHRKPTATSTPPGAKEH